MVNFSHPVSVGDNGENVNEPDGIEGFFKRIKDLFDKFIQDSDRVNKENRYHLRQIMKLRQPVYAPLSKSVTLDANGNGILDFGGPQHGRRWLVRNTSLSDAGSYFTSMGSAKAVLAVGQNIRGTILPNMVRWAYASVPVTDTFGSDQMWIVPRDHVLISVTGGNASQAIQGTIWVQDFPEDAFVTEAVV